MFKYFVFLLFFSLTVKAVPININTANGTELAKSLNGIGFKKAQAIIDYRDKHGSFSSLNELNRVKGIGKKTLENNQQDIFFTTP
jgi:competence protein ComEA